MLRVLQRLLHLADIRNAGTNPQPAVDPRGAVFICYRQSDGSALAADIAWALRAAGVPVWHDESDLPPGDTERRLAEALQSGLSGAVLLVTPDIQHSRIVREVELPQLLRLEKDSAFTLSVISSIERDSGDLDYDAPDRLLRQAPGTLRRFKQAPAGNQRQRADAARAQGQRRMQAVRKDVEAAGRTITIDIQTRIPPFASTMDAELVLRLRPPLDRQRRPHPLGLQDLRWFLADLPQLLALAGAESVRIRGGAHLSAAFALGAALPTTLIGRVDVIDTAGQVWSLNASPPLRQSSTKHLTWHPRQLPADTTGPILLYMDLLPSRSDAAFDALVNEPAKQFSGAFHIRPVRDGTLEAEGAEGLLGQASRIVRDLANQSQTSEVHLLLRCPWPTALLLGRTLNTLRIHLYEWEDGPSGDANTTEPKYHPSLVVRSGAGGSPIESISSPDSSNGS